MIKYSFFAGWLAAIIVLLLAAGCHAGMVAAPGVTLINPSLGSVGSAVTGQQRPAEKPLTEGWLVEPVVASGGQPAAPVVINPPAVAAITSGTTVQHRVSQGEWLMQIARCYGTSYQAILQSNRLPDPNLIRPGTTIVVPNAGSTGPIIGPPCVQRYTVQSGDTWASLAQKFQTTAAILQQANPGNLSAGRIILVPTIAPAPPVSTGCAVDWFFTFEPQYQHLSAYCPQPVVTVPAVGQDFEGGRVYRYAPSPAHPDGQGAVFVIYNDGYWEEFADTWDASQPASDPAMEVPAGRYQPVESIGKVWRENPDVRARLGWAYEPQQTFMGRTQMVGSDVPFASFRGFIIDHGKWGIALILTTDNMDMGPNPWRVAGKYQ